MAQANVHEEATQAVLDCSGRRLFAQSTFQRRLRARREASTPEDSIGHEGR
jgi:hypothetical protein